VHVVFPTFINDAQIPFPLGTFIRDHTIDLVDFHGRRVFRVVNACGKMSPIISSDCMHGCVNGLSGINSRRRHLAPVRGYRLPLSYTSLIRSTGLIVVPRLASAMALLISLKS
jgi:hypothetical protein